MQKPIKGLMCLPALFVTACQSIPLQEDLTRVSTVEITTHILCEMKATLESGDFKYFTSAAFNKKNKYIEDEYAISFDFDFSARQKNKKSADLNLVFPVALGTLSIGLDKGDIEDENYSQEKFKITKGFGTFKKLPCNQVSSHHMLVQEPAGALPIRGKIGLDKIIEQYFTLKHFNSTNLESFSRKIEFKVTSNLGTKGTVSIERANGEKIEANAGASGNRVDWHQLTLTIAHAPTKSEQQKKKEYEKQRTYFVVIRDKPITEPGPENLRGMFDSIQPGAVSRSSIADSPSADAERKASRQLEDFKTQNLIQDLRDDVRELKAE